MQAQSQLVRVENDVHEISMCQSAMSDVRWAIGWREVREAWGMRCDGMGCDGRQGRLTSAERGIISGFRVPVEVVGGCVAGDAMRGMGSLTVPSSSSIIGLLSTEDGAVG